MLCPQVCFSLHGLKSQWSLTNFPCISASSTYHTNRNLHSRHCTKKASKTNHLILLHMHGESRQFWTLVITCKFSGISQVINWQFTKDYWVFKKWRNKHCTIQINDSAIAEFCIELAHDHRILDIISAEFNHFCHRLELNYFCNSHPFSAVEFKYTCCRINNRCMLSILFLIF